jgi:hypothetical protein
VNRYLAQDTDVSAIRQDEYQNEFDASTLDDFRKNTEMSANHQDGHAPSFEDFQPGQHRSPLVSTGSTAGPTGHAKQMKAASKSSQFYTTIVMKVGINTRERAGVVNPNGRSIYIFKHLEIGLRDRIAYPLPGDVLLKDLMAFSYFTGVDSEEQFHEYCVACTRPLETNMREMADRLYNHKFTDIKRHLTNQVIPKFLAILKKITGSGKKSG